MAKDQRNMITASWLLHCQSLMLASSSLGHLNLGVCLNLLPIKRTYSREAPLDR